MHCRKSSAFSRGLPKYRGLPRYVLAIEILSLVMESNVFMLTLDSFLIKEGADGTSFLGRFDPNPRNLIHCHNSKKPK